MVKPSKTQPMKPLIAILAILCCPVFAFCQDITGLWKGSLYNNDTQQTLQYEVLVSKNDHGKYTGVSHTWFVINDKKYYGIKKVDVRIAKDGKIVLQDAELIANNYPDLSAKPASQLNVLDLSNPGEDASLEGGFRTIRTKEYAVSMTGHINLKKTSVLAQSDLLDYLHKNEKDNMLTVAVK